MNTANITGSTCLTLYRSKDLSYRLFIKVKVLIFVFKLYTGALTGVWTGAVSLSLHGLHRDQCLAPCYTTFLR